MRDVAVNVLIDYPPDHPYHRASVAALLDASGQTGLAVDVRIVPTDTIHTIDDVVGARSAVFIGPGTPYRQPEVANEVIQAARERGVPLVAT